MKKLTLAFIGFFLAVSTIAQIPISGEISGILQGYTYIVQGHLVVIETDSLFILPGAVFLFDSLYRFDIYGYLSAVGTEDDSIYFMPNEGVTRWQGMVFNWGASDNCILSYCYFTGASIGAINCYYTDMTISHCTVESNNANWGGGMYISWSNCVISQCLVKDNVSVNNGGGIYCTHASPVISNCEITGNISDNGGGGSGMGGGGICNNHMSYSTITGCIIYDNYSYGHGGGVVFNDRSDGSLTECSIFDNSSQDGAGGLYIGYASPIISTCTFSGNTTDSSGGAILVEFIGHPIITNNIIEGSFSLDGGIYLDSLQSTIIEYCDFFNNVVSNVAGSIIPEGFGLLSQVNNNGDSCDVFHNIFLNPLYVNQATGNFNLLINSPCIEAGNPLSAPDPDSTICDIGAFYYPQGEPGIYDLTITKIGVNNMLLDWSDIPGAGVYHIYRSDTPIFDITAIPPYIDTPNSHFFDYGTVISGTKWWYKVTWEE